MLAAQDRGCNLEIDRAFQDIPAVRLADGHAGIVDQVEGPGLGKFFRLRDFGSRHGTALHQHRDRGDAADRDQLRTEFTHPLRIERGAESREQFRHDPGR